MIDTDKYISGPDDERLMTLSNRELRLAVWAYSSELRNMKKDSTHTDDFTLAEVKRLREAFITAVRQLDVESRNKMFNDDDGYLQNVWLFRSE